jgi:hypothetical protein
VVLETSSLTRRFGEYTAVDASRFRSPVRASFPPAVCRIWISWLPASAQSVFFVAIFYDMLTGGGQCLRVGRRFHYSAAGGGHMVMIGGKLYPRVAT